MIGLVGGVVQQFEVCGSKSNRFGTFLRKQPCCATVAACVGIFVWCCLAPPVDVSAVARGGSFCAVK